MFGAWTVIGNSNKINSQGKRVFVICKCSCGKEKDVNKYNLLYGKSTKCTDCYKSEMIKQNTKHGMSYSKEHQKWRDMKDRCYNHKNKHYRDYGGRGIFVCRRWRKSFKKFFKDMGECSPKMSLDRSNNDGPYGPWNCTWENARDRHIIGEVINCNLQTYHLLENMIKREKRKNGLQINLLLIHLRFQEL